jgi:GNAT superfamily N-acetyltransferase
MSGVMVRDVTEENLDDAFRVCSNGRLGDPLQMQGIKLRQQWIRRMLAATGPCVKVAYLDGRPVVQLLFYPETSVPYLPHPRAGVVLLRCVYNPFKEAQGKGASTALIKNLIEDCKRGPRCLNGGECSFIASEAFNTGEGVPMERLYEANGFKKMGGEMAYEIAGKYTPPRELSYTRSAGDEGRAIVVYNPTCEYSYPAALRVRELIAGIYPAMPVELVNQWEEPLESSRLANHELTVNGVQINSSLHQREKLVDEVRKAVKGASQS